MRLSRWLFSLVWLVALLHLPSAFAMQKTDTFPTPSDYSIKMPRHSGKGFSYYEVPAASGLCPLARHEFKRIKDWQRPPDQKGDPTAIQFKFRRVDDAIEVDLSLTFGPVPRSSTLPENGLPAQTIAAYSLRLGETAFLQELARFGVEPFEIKVVSSNSRSLDPSRAINLTKSISVVRIDKARDHYRVIYKNISSKNITSFRYNYWADHIYSSYMQSFKKSLIAPGETIEQHFNYSRKDHPMRLPARIMISGVVFDDLTYDSDKEEQLRVAALLRAQLIQHPQIIPLLKEAVAVYEQDKKRALDKLKKDVAALNVEPESNVITGLVKRLAPMTESEIGRLIYHLKKALVDGRDDLIRRIDLVVRMESTIGAFIHGCPDDVRQHWLAAFLSCYEESLRKRLSSGIFR